MGINEPDLLDCHGFRQVADQTEDQQRALLRSTEPRVRVWAAWSLGQRLSRGFCEDARLLIAEEPVPGVRRHLLVMLAGFGEVDIVAALARHDPDVYVRSTAARFVGELAEMHPDALAIAERLLDDPADVIRAAIIAGLPKQLPRGLELKIRATHDDESPLVRDALTRRAFGDGDYQTVRRNAFADPDTGVRWLALRTLVAAVGVGSALQGLDSSQLHAALDDLDKMEVQVPFEHVEALQPGPEFLRILDPGALGSAGRIWLLGLMARPSRDYWRTLMRAYDGVEITDPTEVRAVHHFVELVEQTLLCSDPTEEVGALAPWGTWSVLDSDRYKLLTLLREMIA